MATACRGRGLSRRRGGGSRAGCRSGSEHGRSAIARRPAACVVLSRSRVVRLLLGELGPDRRDQALLGRPPRLGARPGPVAAAPPFPSASSTQVALVRRRPAASSRPVPASMGAVRRALDLTRVVVGGSVTEERVGVHHQPELTLPTPRPLARLMCSVAGAGGRIAEHPGGVTSDDEVLNEVEQRGDPALPDRQRPATRVDVRAPQRAVGDRGVQPEDVLGPGHHRRTSTTPADSRRPGPRCGSAPPTTPARWPGPASRNRFTARWIRRRQVSADGASHGALPAPGTTASCTSVATGPGRPLVRSASTRTRARSNRPASNAVKVSARSSCKRRARSTK